MARMEKSTVHCDPHTLIYTVSNSVTTRQIVILPVIWERFLPYAEVAGWENRVAIDMMCRIKVISLNIKQLGVNL